MFIVSKYIKVVFMFSGDVSVALVKQIGPHCRLCFMGWMQLGLVDRYQCFGGISPS